MPTSMFWHSPRSVISPSGHRQQVVGRHLHVVAAAVDLVGLRHAGVEGRLGDGHQAGMGHPRAVVAVAGLAVLVGPDLLHGLVVGLRDRS